MNIRSRLLKVANNILADINFNSQKEFEEYIKNHPNYREDTKFFVDGMQVSAPPREKNNGEGKEIKMTDEQKKLHEMAMNGDNEDKAYVAAQYDTHPYTLHLLSHEDDSEIKQNVSLNPNVSPKTLCNLISRLDKYDKYEVATNPSTPAEALDILSHDDYYKEDIIEHPNVTIEILERLIKDETYRKDVICKMLEFPNLSEESIDNLYDYVIDENDDEIAYMFVNYCYDNGHDNYFSDYYLNGKLYRYDSFGDRDYTYYQDNSSDPIWRALAKRDGFEYNKNSGGDFGVYSRRYK